MHPTLRSRSRVGVPLQPNVSLSYDRLGDAVLALGFSFEEISLASGMPVGTAKCYARRGRAAMRELLETGSPA